MDIRFRRRLAPGGFADNLALSAMSASIFPAHPAIASGTVLDPVASMLLAGAGGAWSVNRVLNAKYRPVFTNSKVKINSDTTYTDHDRDGMILGYTVDTGKPVVVPWDIWTRHCLVVGQSGVGKTVFAEWIMLQQMLRSGGLAMVDGKVDAGNLKKMDQMAAWTGRRADLGVINLGDPNRSNTYNSILYGDADEVTSRLLSLIPSSANNPGTDYYRQAANQGLTTLIGAIQASGKAYNFIDLSILLTNSKALSHLESIVPPGDAKKALSLFLEQFRAANKDGIVSIDMKRMKEVFGGIGGRLHLFGSGNFGQIGNTYSPDIVLYEAVRGNKMVYVALPTMGKAEAASNFGKIFLGDIKTTVSWLQQLPPHERPFPSFLFFADEAGSYMTEAWQVMLEQNRSAGVTLMPAFQTMANLENVSKELREVILGNTWTKVFFKIGTDETADSIVKQIGQEKRAAISLSVGAGSGTQQDATGTGRKGASGSDSSGITEREELADRVTDDMLRALGMGEAIVTIGGDEVYHIKVPQIQFDKAFAETIGEFSLNKKRAKFVDGLNYFRDVNKWLSTNG